LHQVVYHEIGHNWDQPHENDSAPEFYELSGWTRVPQGESVPPDLSQGTDNSDWYYRSDATFARYYARSNPREDFAEAFSAYFLDGAGLPYLGGPGAQAIPRKTVYLDRFLDSLVTETEV
jgi:hypothetical protein